MITEEAAQAFYGRAGGSPAPAAEPVPDPFAALLEPPALPAPAPTPEAPPRLDPEAQAEDFYGGPKAPTRGTVDWGEPPAQPADYRLEAPPGVLDMSEAGRAAMARLREGLAVAGAGQSLGAELFADATRAQQGGALPVSQATAEQELRQEYGTHYDQRMDAARALIRQANQRCPEIVPFLERTGLGNDPAFIRKVVAAARRRGR